MKPWTKNILPLAGKPLIAHSIESSLKNGADKVTLNSSLLQNVNLLSKAAKIFGSSTITCAIEAVKIKNKYYVSTLNGRELYNLSPFPKIFLCGNEKEILGPLNHL